MGCKINLKCCLASSSDKATVFVKLRDSQVRIKRGFWAKFPWRKSGFKHNTKIARFDLDPGQDFDNVFKFRNTCSAKRRYRFMVGWQDEHQGPVSFVMLYWPSETTYTTSTTIDLGDLDQYID